MSAGYYLVTRHSRATEAERFESPAAMIDAIADSGGEVDSDVVEVIHRYDDPGDCGVYIVSRPDLDRACTDHVANLRAEQKHRAQVRREYRESVL